MFLEMHQSIGWWSERVSFKVDRPWLANQSEIIDSVPITFTSVMVHVVHQKEVEQWEFLLFTCFAPPPHALILSRASGLWCKQYRRETGAWHRATLPPFLKLSVQNPPGHMLCRAHSYIVSNITDTHTQHIVSLEVIYYEWARYKTHFCYTFRAKISWEETTMKTFSVFLYSPVSITCTCLERY